MARSKSGAKWVSRLCRSAFEVEVQWLTLAVFARVGLFLRIPFPLYLKLRSRKLFLRRSTAWENDISSARPRRAIFPD